MEDWRLSPLIIISATGTRCNHTPSFLQRLVLFGYTRVYSPTCSLGTQGILESTQSFRLFVLPQVPASTIYLAFGTLRSGYS